MKPRPHGVTATQELHELATKKGVEAKFKFIEPLNFEFKSAMRLWSRDEMRGSYKVHLTISGYEFFGQADLPQQAKHNAAIQVNNCCILLIVCIWTKSAYGVSFIDTSPFYFIIGVTHAK